MFLGQKCIETSESPVWLSSKLQLQDG